MERPPRYYDVSIDYAPLSIKFFPLSNSHCRITAITVFESSEDNNWQKLWSVEANPQSVQEELKTVTYGNVPTSWIQVYPARPIRTETRHRIRLITTEGKFDIDIPIAGRYKGIGCRTQL